MVANLANLGMFEKILFQGLHFTGPYATLNLQSDICGMHINA